ncbi:unnamed protein product [Peronospora farinosa]|uniref:Uncharacterized protein n=1 Tax=Peronospora farinosa TaxID=134698 RepID=A0AAV0TE55_9STRA|nr:unnamed protein product [Peronospora farinosa]CAI5720500.1 unnamed protein product [Peronospora farinosa]
MGQESVRTFDTLQKIALASCSWQEYLFVKLEAEFGEPIAGLHIGSSLKPAMKEVIASASSFKLQQRAMHMWGEVERVKQFQTICASLTREVQSLSDQKIGQSSSIRTQLKCLGKS